MPSRGFKISSQELARIKELPTEQEKRLVRDLHGGFLIDLGSEVIASTGELFTKALEDNATEGTMVEHYGHRGRGSRTHKAQVATLQHGDKALHFEREMDVYNQGRPPVKVSLIDGEESTYAFVFAPNAYRFDDKECKPRIGLIQGSTFLPESQEQMQQDFVDFMQEAAEIIGSQRPHGSEPSDIGRVALS